MSLFPQLPLSTDAQLGLPLLSSQPRSHLVEKAPTGEPLAQRLTWDQERQALQDQINHLLRRVEQLDQRAERLEQGLAARTLRGRWERFLTWIREAYRG